MRDTARRVSRSIGAGETTLVLGGDCTVGIGTVAGHVGAGERVGLIYFDTHADLNVPESVREGTLDWMGMAHMLGEQGAVPELVAAGPRAPLLEPEDVLLFGWGREQATRVRARGDRAPRHRGRAGRRGRRRPRGRRGARACALMEDRFDRVLVHFDVDVDRLHRRAAVGERRAATRASPYDARAAGARRALLASAALAGLTDHRAEPRSHRGRARTASSGSRERLARAVAG